LRGALGLEADAHPTEAMVRKAIAPQLDLAPNADEAHRMSDGLRFLLDLASPLREIDPTRAQEEAGRAFRLFVHLASSRRPVLLWLSDLHWADDLVRAMVDALLERLPRLPLMVMATARHELLDVWTPKPGRHTTIQVTLDPLDREAAAELLSLLLPEEVPERVREELLDRADGNPFYL